MQVWPKHFICQNSTNCKPYGVSTLRSCLIIQIVAETWSFNYRPQHFYICFKFTEFQRILLIPRWCTSRFISKPGPGWRLTGKLWVYAPLKGVKKITYYFDNFLSNWSSSNQTFLHRHYSTRFCLEQRWPVTDTQSVISTEADPAGTLCEQNKKSPQRKPFLLAFILTALCLCS